MRRVLLLSFLSLVCFTGFAQHPEILALKRLNAPSTTELERARDRYDLSDYDSANALYFKALEKGQLRTEDYLYFSNSLRSTDKNALGSELLKEYLRLSGQQFGTVPTMAASVEKSDSLLKPQIQEIAHSDGLFSIHGYNGRIHGSKEGRIQSFQYACEGELSEPRQTFEQPMGTYFSSIAYFNDGFSAVVTKMKPLQGGAKLYVLHRDQDGWSPIKDPLFENVQGNFCSPFFDEANSILYFCSDMSGGQGGYDLYMSFYRKGRFTDPVNLGPKVNTARHELGPVKGPEWLYFSSNGYPSRGGFDLYRYKAVDDFTQLVLPMRNLNSPADEFGLIRLTEFDFVVQRHTERSSELLLFSAPQPLHAYSGRVRNEEGTEIDVPAYVLVQSGTPLSYFELDAYGKFQFFRESSVNSIDIRIVAEGYHSAEATLQANQPAEIRLKAIRTVEITKVVARGADATTQLIPPGADPNEQLTDPELSTEAVTKPEPKVYYVIVGSARSYTNAYRLWNQWVERFTDLSIIQFGPELYRIGFKCGDQELDAIRALKDAIQIKPDAWIIRPGTF